MQETWSQCFGTNLGTILAAYDGDTEPADGLVELLPEIGKEQRYVNFLVFPKSTKIILGFDAIKRFGFSLNT